MTNNQIAADIAADTDIDLDAWQAMADNPLLSDADRLAWQRLVCATKAMIRDDMDMAAQHLVDNFTTHPDILLDNFGR